MANPDREGELARLVRSHERWRAKSVFNLLPSENALSPTARKYLGSDLAGRYTLPHAAPEGEPGSTNDYGGTRFTDAIERVGNEAAARLFHGRYATTRPLSGHLAAMSALVPLLPRGAKILAIPPQRGGYDGYAPGYLPAMFGWVVRPLPAEGPGGSVDAVAAIEEIRKERPSAVLLGQSLFLFPYPLREIAEEAHARGSLVLYDASHVLGLIAGGQFQDPLREGADVLFGSTHKSFPGPQGGLLVTDREDLFRQIDPALTWRVFDNAHWNRIAALAQTLLELERFGPAYARTVVENAQALGGALEERGLRMVAAGSGFTRSHQVHVERAALAHDRQLLPSTLARRWERSRLITDLIGRLGTAEVARLGLTPSDMPKLAELLVRAGLRNERVASEVLRWRRTYRTLAFT
ncbi:MAG: serine hydroxymethyltransferase [Thermoplasmata archaeon]|nr:serine hydroxymethyltransferase [Thermoplasmata archaeon]MCI4359931.1 serine hydroxymethyltransferase [Thermoplasmata archaeon]